MHFSSTEFDGVVELLAQRVGQAEDPRLGLEARARPEAQRGVREQDIQALINYHNLAFLESLYAHYNPTNRMEPVALNRHALAHGLWLTYASEEASTRSFLFLDMVHSLVDELVDSLDGERNDQGTP